MTVLVQDFVLVEGLGRFLKAPLPPPDPLRTQFVPFTTFSVWLLVGARWGGILWLAKFGSPGTSSG